MTLPLPRLEPAPSPLPSDRGGALSDSLAWLGGVELPASRAHFLTIDVEPPRMGGEADGSGVARQVGRLVDLLATAEVNATFFIPEAVAAVAPDTVRSIATAGHEVAARTATGGASPRDMDGFRADAWRIKCLLEDLTGQRVLGHRAALFATGTGLEWAYDALLQDGYEYDSSSIPRRPQPGMGPAAPSAVHVVRRWAGNLVEVPLTTVPVFGRPSPVMGGEWLRHLPYPVVRHALRARERRGEPAVFALRSWEVDGEARPRPERGRWLARVRDQRGLARTAPALERALREFPFTSIASRLAHLRRTAVPFEG